MTSSGGAPGTGGNSDAGAGGATSVALFTDDFEAAAINSKWIPRINGGGTFALDTTHKHGGNQSLHVTPHSGYSTLLAIEGNPIFPAPNNTFLAESG